MRGIPTVEEATMSQGMQMASRSGQRRGCILLWSLQKRHHPTHKHQQIRETKCQTEKLCGKQHGRCAYRKAGPRAHRDSMARSSVIHKGQRWKPPKCPSKGMDRQKAVESTEENTIWP